MEKKPFDFEVFKKRTASRLKNGDTLLGKKAFVQLAWLHEP